MWGWAAPDQNGGVGCIGGIPLSSGNATGRRLGDEGHDDETDDVGAVDVDALDAGLEGG